MCECYVFEVIKGEKVYIFVDFCIVCKALYSSFVYDTDTREYFNTEQYKGGFESKNKTQKFYF